MKAILFIGFLSLAGFVLLGFQQIQSEKQEKISIMEGKNSHLEKATFAGGCFWCMESDFEKHLSSLIQTLKDIEPLPQTRHPNHEVYNML